MLGFDMLGFKIIFVIFTSVQASHYHIRLGLLKHFGDLHHSFSNGNLGGSRVVFGQSPLEVTIYKEKSRPEDYPIIKADQNPPGE